MVLCQMSVICDLSSDRRDCILKANGVHVQAGVSRGSSARGGGRLAEATTDFRNCFEK